MFDKSLTAHLAELSKIKFTENELSKISNDMDSIVALMDTLSDFDAKGYFSLLESKGIEELRADIPEKSMDREAALKNAAKKEKNFFEVPRVV